MNATEISLGSMAHVLEEPQNDNTKKLHSSFFPKGIKKLTAIINSIYTFSPLLAARMTMLLFSVAIRKKITEDDKNFYKRGKLIEFRSGKHKYNAYEYGDGPVVIFVHGWISNGARWKSYIDSVVKEGFKAVVVDAPAHGNSPGRFLSVPDFALSIKEVIENYQNIHAVVTHSMGSIVSTIALNMAKNNNPNLKLVLMNSFVDSDALISRFACCIGIADTVMAYTKKWIVNYTYAPLMYFSIPVHLEQLQAEILFISDDNDIVVPAIEVEKILSINTEMVHLRTKGLGHNLKSDEVVFRVLDHLRF